MGGTNEEWKVIEQDERTILLEKRPFGSLKMHAVVFVLTVWWTAGIGNLVYALYKSEEVGHRRLGPEDAEEEISAKDTPNTEKLGPEELS